MRRIASFVLLAAALVVSVCAATASANSSKTCPVTVPPAGWKANGPEFGPGHFNYGSDRLRAQLYWPRGLLKAGTLPDGGSMATIQADGSISLKLGWWRGLRGRLVITGRRLDRPGRLRADVPPTGSYGDRGFIPSGIVFPSTGCWRVVGALGWARLAFVVKVTKLPHG